MVAARLEPAVDEAEGEVGLDGKGLPVVPGEDMPGPLWISAARTLTRLGDMAERAGVTFCLENLNTAVDHPGVPFAPWIEQLYRDGVTSGCGVSPRAA